LLKKLVRQVFGFDERKKREKSLSRELQSTQLHGQLAPECGIRSLRELSHTKKKEKPLARIALATSCFLLPKHTKHAL
jgi:hypothetical protein